MAKRKQEALTVTRFISEVLVSQLSIPLKQIVNDTTFTKYTGSQRPDLLLSEFEYDIDKRNDDEFIRNLVAYAEAKDDCAVDDKDWKDAKKQGKKKSALLGLPYFIVTNCKTSTFYNAFLPEFYLRPYEAKYIGMEELERELHQVRESVRSLAL